MTDSQYREQQRGGDRAYETSLVGQDIHMRQQVVRTANHLMVEGSVADMGIGLDAGSFALASGYSEQRLLE